MADEDQGGSPERDEYEDLRRMVEEVARAARDAKEASDALREERPSRFERFVETITGLLRALVDLVTNRIANELERARRAGEVFVAQLLEALGRSLSNAGSAIGNTAAALLFGGIAAVVLTVAVTQGLNRLIGEPWGTLIVGLVFAVLALAFYIRARDRLAAIRDEAERLRAWSRK